MADKPEQCEIPVSLGSGSEDFSLEGTFDSATRQISVSVDNLRRLVRASTLYRATTVTLDMGGLAVEPHTIAVPAEIYSHRKEEQVYTFADGRIVVDALRHVMRVDQGEPTKLDRLQVRIIGVLWSYIDTPLPREFIHEAVTVPDSPYNATTLNSYISRIRKSFGDKDLRDPRLGALRSINRLSVNGRHRPVCDYALVSTL